MNKLITKADLAKVADEFKLQVNESHLLFDKKMKIGVKKRKKECVNR